MRSHKPQKRTTVPKQPKKPSFLYVSGSRDSSGDAKVKTHKPLEMLDFPPVEQGMCNEPILLCPLFISQYIHKHRHIPSKRCVLRERRSKSTKKISRLIAWQCPGRRGQHWVSIFRVFVSSEQRPRADNVRSAKGNQVLRVFQNE